MYLYFQLPDSGVDGNLLASAPRPVDEDFNSCQGAAILLLQQMVEKIVREKNIGSKRKFAATLNPVLAEVIL